MYSFRSHNTASGMIFNDDYALPLTYAHVGVYNLGEKEPTCKTFSE